MGSGRRCFVDGFTRHRLLKLSRDMVGFRADSGHGGADPFSSGLSFAAKFLSGGCADGA